MRITIRDCVVPMSRIWATWWPESITVWLN